MLCRCGSGSGGDDGRRDEIGGKGSAGFDVGVFAMVEEGEWSDHRDECSRVRRRRLTFESSGTAQIEEADRCVKRVSLKIDFTERAAGAGLFDLGYGNGGGIAFVSDDGAVDSEVVGEGQENFVADFGGLRGDVLRED